MQSFHDVVEKAAYLHYRALSSFELLNKDERYIYFQQDGVRAHTSEQTMELLHEFFNDRFISIGLWPPRSPDVTPLNYFLLNHLKNKIFATPPATIEELSRCIASLVHYSILTISMFSSPLAPLQGLWLGDAGGIHMRSVTFLQGI